VGLFDEDFFLIHEDSDLNLRALIAGKRCVYVPTAVVRHKRGATTDAQPAWEMQRHEIRNRGAVMAKGLPWPLVPLAVIMWPWRLLRSTFPLRPGNWHLIPGLVRSIGKRIGAEAEGVRIGRSKRSDVWRRRAVPVWEVVRWLLHGTGRAS
jgi:GT2 family glycosyltransferase